VLRTTHCIYNIIYTYAIIFSMCLRLVLVSIHMVLFCVYVLRCTMPTPTEWRDRSVYIGWSSKHMSEPKYCNNNNDRVPSYVSVERSKFVCVRSVFYKYHHSAEVDLTFRRNRLRSQSLKCCPVFLTLCRVWSTHFL